MSFLWDITVKWIFQIFCRHCSCVVSLAAVIGGCCWSLSLDLPPRVWPISPMFALMGHSFRVSGSVNVAPRSCANKITGGRFASCDYSTCIIRGLLNSKGKKRCYLWQRRWFTFIVNRNIFMMHFLINTISPLWVLKWMELSGRFVLGRGSDSYRCCWLC